MTEKASIKFKNVTFHCSVEVSDRLDKLCEMSDCARSKLIFDMVVVMIDYLELTEKVGIMHLGLLFKDAKDKLKCVAKKLCNRKEI